MKVMMVAVFTERSTNISQARGFERNNCEVIRYDYRHKASLMGSDKRDDDIINTCVIEKPDIIFFSKCNEVNIRVVHECNKISKTVLWYMDPLNVCFDSSLREKIRFSNYTFCALVEPYREAINISPNSVYFLQEGFDEDSNFPMNVPYVNDVSFIGNLRGQRKIYFENMKFKVYNSAYNEEHSRAVSETRINLNFTEGGTSDRTYKVLASRGFLLTQPWPDMEKDFKIKEDFDIFDSIGELRMKIKYYLENDIDRLRIAEHGYKTVQKFTRTNFTKEIIKRVLSEDYKYDTVSQA